MAQKEMPPVIAVTVRFESSAASVSSSKIATYVMAPAANPRPPGSSGTNFSTKRKAGTAKIGCGRLVKMAQSTGGTQKELEVEGHNA